MRKQVNSHWKLTVQLGFPQINRSDEPKLAKNSANIWDNLRKILLALIESYQVKFISEKIDKLNKFSEKCDRSVFVSIHEMLEFTEFTERK